MIRPSIYCGSGSRDAARDKRQTACKPGSVAGRKPTRWPFIWDARYRAPRATDPGGRSGNRPGSGLATAPHRPYLVLLPEGFAMPHPLPGARCALTAPFHPCPPALRPRASGLLSVALSLGSPPPGVTRLRASVEPGLSSATRPGRRRRPSGRLARPDYACDRARSSHSQLRPAVSAQTSWSIASGAGIDHLRRLAPDGNGVERRARRQPCPRRSRRRPQGRSR